MLETFTTQELIEEIRKREAKSHKDTPLDLEVNSLAKEGLRSIVRLGSMIPTTIVEYDLNKDKESFRSGVNSMKGSEGYNSHTFGSKYFMVQYVWNNDKIISKKTNYRV